MAVSLESLEHLMFLHHFTCGSFRAVMIHDVRCIRTWAKCLNMVNLAFLMKGVMNEGTENMLSQNYLFLTIKYTYVCSYASSGCLKLFYGLLSLLLSPNVYWEMNTVFDQSSGVLGSLFLR